MKTSVLIFFFLSLILFPVTVFAATDCSIAANKDKTECIFGKITAPAPVAQFIAKDTATFGISPFLSNIISLFYTVGAVVLVFMLLWGAFDWIISEGNKEKIQSAQQKIISAIIGIILFAVAFAVITIVGQFTGFKFFEGQGVTRTQTPEGQYRFVCPDNTVVVVSNPSYEDACKIYGYR